MKRLFSKLMIFLGVFALIMGTITTFGINLSYAANLEVIGNDIGLEVQPSGRKLFNLTNMNPGDTNEAVVNINNTNECKFELFIRTERMTQKPAENEADLFKQMVLTIYYAEEMIYYGSMEDFAQSNISLGFLEPGDAQELRAIVHLPGPETGNEFQGKSVLVKWIFMAEQRCEPDNPGEPGNPDNPEEPLEPDYPEESVKFEDYSIVEQIAQEELPVTLESLDEDEIIEIIDEIPEATISPVMDEPPTRSSLPRTGVASGIIYYVLGSILLGIGIRTNKKD